MGTEIIKPVSAIGLAVCDKIVEGKSIQTACREMGIGTETFYIEMRENPDLQASYTHARSARADARFEKIDDIMDDMRAGEIDPVTAKVMLDAIKWQCSKEKAATYGDSTTIRGDKDNPIAVQALATALEERVKARIEHAKSGDSINN